MNNQDLVPIITMEECAEVTQAIAKVFRFGLNQKHPETNLTNRDALAIEIGQLLYMLKELMIDWKLDVQTVNTAYEEKSHALFKWSKYFKENIHEKI